MNLIESQAYAKSMVESSYEYPVSILKEVCSILSTYAYPSLSAPCITADEVDTIIYDVVNRLK